MIFCNRKTDVDTVAKSLKKAGYNAAPIHGDLDQSQRTRTLNEFREQTLKFLVCSDVAARGLDIPAVVGARSASQLIKQDDWVVIDGDGGVLLVDPSPTLIEEYIFKQREGNLERERLTRLRHTPAVTLDGEAVQLMANIEQPGDTDAAIEAGAVGVGLFRSEFLFRDDRLLSVGSPESAPSPSCTID